jgi:serine phosphatase RsbU (regulator of sigma subunit)
VLPPYATLGSPPLIAYGLMITLTTLRLRPWLCVLAGAVGAGSYGLLLLYIRFGIGLRHDPAGLPNAAFINSAKLILISGIAGAWVAREIRRHAEAALGEERTRAENDRMERDLAVARSIQQALVPRGAPEIAGFEVCGWNRPADQTGGDYYDWQRMPDGNWIVTLADVSGHGVGPAMVTAACRAYVRASSAHHGDLPSLATRINRLLAEDLPEGRFITMVNVLIDPRGGPLSLLSAGHSPIVLYIGGSGAVEDILPQDMPLAVVADQEFGPARAVEMKRGDVLALVTDGLVEWSRSSASGKGELFGLERRRQSLKRHATLAGPELIAAVTADAEAFAGGEPQQDDLTMVVIRRTG